MSGTWASGWAVDDVVTAEEFGKGVGLVADSTLTGAAASIALASLPATYAALRVVIFARGATSATSTSLFLNFNNDTGANYDDQRLSLAANTVVGTEAFAATAITIGTIPAATAPAGSYGAYDLILPRYSNTSYHKVVTGTGAVKIGTTTGTLFVRSLAAFWRSTAAISTVTIAATGNLDVGSRMSIYGLGD